MTELQPTSENELHHATAGKIPRFLSELLGEPSSPHTCEPVTIATGNKIQRERDFTSSPEVPLILERTYNKQWNTTGIFGPAWASTYDQKLGFKYFEGQTPKSCTITPGSDECFPENVDEIYVHTGNGAQYTFKRDPSAPVFVNAKPQSTATISQQGSNWELITEDKDTLIYSTSGRILSAVRRNGIGWTYEYDQNGYLQRVVHSSGADVEFTWTGDRVSTVTDPAGATYSYTYLGGRLVGVTYPSGTGSRTYHYEDGSLPDALTGVSADGQRYSSVSYHPGGLVKESGLVGGVRESAFSYGLFSTTVTNASGAVSKYTFLQGAGGRMGLSKVERSGISDCPNGLSQVAYDANGYIDYTIDWNGNKTDFTFNAQGQLQNQKAGINSSFSGRERYTTYTWNADNQIRTIKQYGATTADFIKETTHYYTHPAGATPGRIARIEEFNRSANGVANQLRQTRFTYTIHPNKLIKTVTIDGPRTDVADTALAEFNTQGYLTAVTDAVGHKTSYGNHNGRGQPLLVTDPNGLQTEYTYNQRGQLASQKLLTTPTRTTSYEYHALGKVKKITRPDGSVVNYNYNSTGSLVGFNQSGQDEALFATNTLGEIEEQTQRCRTSPSCDVPGTTYRRLWAYDQIGRLKLDQGNFTNPSDPRRRTAYRYDNNGNLLQLNELGSTTPLDRTSNLTYGPNNELIQVTDQLGNVTSFQYDGGGRLRTLTDPKGVVTTYAYDGFGNVVSEQSTDTGTQLYGYDAAGNLVKYTRGAGTADQVVVDFTYDRLNRLMLASSSTRSDSYRASLPAPPTWCSASTTESTV